MYEICLNTIQTYARCNSNRLTLDTTAEENAFQDILLLMQLLTNLPFKDIFDLSPSDPNSRQEHSVTPENVFLYGLNIVMPMITMDLLKFPSLCLQ